MSARNGDKARFQRQRQASLRRRKAARLALAGLRVAAAQVRAVSEEAEADRSVRPAS